MVHIPDDVAKEIAAQFRQVAASASRDAWPTVVTAGPRLTRWADLLDPSPAPKIGERIRITAEGVVTAYDPGSDAVQLDHEECWWPYSDCGTRVSYVVVPDIDLNTVHLPPRTLMHRVVEALDVAGYGIGAATVFSIVAPVFADFLAEQPFTSHDAGQRQYDCVKALRDEV